jgi:hypothetical protein
MLTEFIAGIVFASNASAAAALPAIAWQYPALRASLATIE